MSLYWEIKHRKVFRVAVVYAATAFVVLQAADLTLPRLGVPEWGMSLIVVLLAVGFPIPYACPPLADDRGVAGEGMN